MSPDGVQAPPSAPTGFMVVPDALLRGLLHASTCLSEYEEWDLVLEGKPISDALSEQCGDVNLHLTGLELGSLIRGKFAGS